MTICPFFKNFVWNKTTRYCKFPGFSRNKINLWIIKDANRDNQKREIIEETIIIKTKPKENQYIWKESTFIYCNLQFFFLLSLNFQVFFCLSILKLPWRGWCLLKVILRDLFIIVMFLSCINPFKKWKIRLCGGSLRGLL